MASFIFINDHMRCIILLNNLTGEEPEDQGDSVNDMPAWGHPGVRTGIGIQDHPAPKRVFFPFPQAASCYSKNDT